VIGWVDGLRYLDFLSSSLRGELHTPRMHAAVNEALDFPSAWPALALTMVPKVDLDTLRWMVEDVVSEILFHWYQLASYAHPSYRK